MRLLALVLVLQLTGCAVHFPGFSLALGDSSVSTCKDDGVEVVGGTFSSVFSEIFRGTIGIAVEGVLAFMGRPTLAPSIAAQPLESGKCECSR